MTNITPSIEQIIAATGGKESRDGKSVVVGYGPLGYLRVTPDYAIESGEERPAARIEGKLSRRNGARHAELRAALEAAGIRPV